MDGQGQGCAQSHRVSTVAAEPREQFKVAAQYEWVIGPILKPVQGYLESLKKYPNPPAADITNFSSK